MTEFLTENAFRAYPLERGGRHAGDYALLDASIGHLGVPEDGRRVSLLYCRVSATGVLYRIGVAADDCIDVAAGNSGPGHRVVFASSDRYRVFLTIDGAALAKLCAMAAGIGALEGDVGNPFALRCVSQATRFVTGVEAYASLDRDGSVSCGAVEFPETASPVATATGDAVIASGDGIDVAAVQSSPDADTMLRISALAAPADSEEASSAVDVVVRGDDCITVEAIPGAYASSGGAILPCTSAGMAEDACGVIRIGAKCKPCCQCEDYRDAVEMLRPPAVAAEDTKTLLDEVRALYDAAVSEFEKAKMSAVAAVGSYDNVMASATTALSGGVGTGVVASGTRSRISVTLIVANRTLETCAVSDVEFTVPGFGATPVRRQWATAGTSPSSGTDDGLTWRLAPGDALTVVATYAKTAQSNTAVKPSGMKAAFKASLPPRSDIARAASRKIEVAVA